MIMQEEKKKGGARPGAGRKALGKVQICCRVSPMAEKNLRAMAAAKKISIGEVLDRMLKYGCCVDD